jgi:hypothetical protein
MRSPRWFSWALFAQAAGLALTSLSGPLAMGVIDYRYGATMLNQATGLDAFALFVVAPVAVAAGVLSLRDHRAGPLLALGPAVFALYMLVQYVVGPEYLTIDGNGERFFPWFVAQFVLSGTIVCQAWALAEPPPATGRQRRRRGTTLLAVAAFVVVGMYLTNGFLDAITDFPAYVERRAATSEYDEHPTAYWIVALLDLAVVVPVTAAVGLGLRSGRPWADRAFYGVVGWFALVPGSVAAMSIVMLIRDDPAADAGKAMFLGVVAIGLGVLGSRVFVPLFGGSAGVMPERPDRESARAAPGQVTFGPVAERP